MKKTLLFVLIVSLVFTSAFAQGTKEQAKGEKEIVILVKNMGNGFFDAVYRGSQEAVAEIGGMKTVYMGPPQPTAEGQIEIIETLIAQRVDGIAISANDADALIPVAKKAMAAGIKVISFDSGISVGGRIVDLVPPMRSSSVASRSSSPQSLPAIGRHRRPVGKRPGNQPELVDQLDEGRGQGCQVRQHAPRRGRLWR